MATLNTRWMKTFKKFEKHMFAFTVLLQAYLTDEEFERLKADYAKVKGQKDCPYKDFGAFVLDKVQISYK